MFDKQKITAILPAKSGMGKNGKPYSFYKIKTDRHGDKILSTFGDKVTESWKIGDEIEIKVTETVSPDGRFTNYNFEYPKKPKDNERLASLEITVDQLKRKLQEVIDHLKGNKPENLLTSAGTPIPFDKASKAQFDALSPERQKEATETLYGKPTEYPKDTITSEDVPW